MGHTKEYYRENRKHPIRRIIHKVNKIISSTTGQERFGNYWFKQFNFTPEELLNKVQGEFKEGMTWNNYGRGEGKWRIYNIKDPHPKTIDCQEFIDYWKLDNFYPDWCINNKRSKEDIVEYQKEYSKKNRKKLRSYSLEYSIKNRKRLRQQRLPYERERRKDPMHKLNSAMGSGIRYSLRFNKGGIHWEQFVNYNFAQLKVHIESKFTPGMSWGNIGKWHIDHIIPIRYQNPDGTYHWNQEELKDPSSETFKKCWALNNLQPMWAEDNLKKNNRSTLSNKKIQYLEAIKSIFSDQSVIEEDSILVINNKIALNICEFNHEYQYRENFNIFTMYQKRNIQILTIYENEWLNKKDIIIDIIKAKLNLLNRINARDTDFKEIDIKLAKEFLMQNHIQGYTISTHAFGLFKEEELIGVMTFGDHHRDRNKALVLNRMAFKKGLTILGGPSKLFSNSMKQLNQYKIISWADNRFSNGNVYNKLGFINEENLPPDYSYFKDGIIHSKQSKKKNDIDRLTGLTERELRSKEGYCRIYDCGKIRFIYNNIN